MPYQTPKINLYRNISISFVIFTFLLLVSVFFLFYSHATVTITAAAEKMNLNFSAEVKQNPTDQEVKEKDVIAGQFATMQKSATSTFSVLSTKTLDNSTIIGTVKIVNNYNRNQVLAKTTQLQSDNGIIVRTNAAVTVPAGGSVTVEVYPKDPATFEEIAPGNLTIIKLSPSLQDKIYAVTEVPLTNSPAEVKVVGDSDINRAKESLLKQIAQEAKTDLGLNEKNDVIADAVAWTASKKVGDTADSFELSMTASVKYLDINKTELENLVTRKINALNLDGMRVGQLDKESIYYTISDDNFGGGALIKINYSLMATIGKNNSMFGRENFAGKSTQEIRQYLSQFGSIKDVSITNSPSWKKTLPKQGNKIDIIVK